MDHILNSTVEMSQAELNSSTGQNQCGTGKQA